MKNIKSYSDFCNEEINFKKILTYGALAGSTLLPISSIGQNYQDEEWRNYQRGLDSIDQRKFDTYIKLKSDIKKNTQYFKDTKRFPVKNIEIVNGLKKLLNDPRLNIEGKFSLEKIYNIGSDNDLIFYVKLKKEKLDGKTSEIEMIVNSVDIEEYLKYDKISNSFVRHMIDDIRTVIALDEDPELLQGKKTREVVNQEYFNDVESELKDIESSKNVSMFKRELEEIKIEKDILFDLIKKNTINWKKEKDSDDLDRKLSISKESLELSSRGTELLIKIFALKEKIKEK
jgi:hypothetical protein